MTITQLKELAVKHIDTAHTSLEYRSATVPETILDLITQVEKLTEALENLSDNTSIDSNGCDCPEIARLALEQFGADKELG